MKKKLCYLSIIAIFGVLSGCNEFELKETDVVIEEDNVTNKQSFEQFVEHVTANKESNVRLVTYTENGEPLLHHLDYKDEMITLNVEKTEGNAKERTVSKTSCESIRVDETLNKVDYSLTGCTDQKDVHLLTLQK
ncbi:DUF4362 domain-containing protein [Metabacillus iocasae]|uniref:DUF4362 domain-containing protein n=1 Tax=Priestia iocasae TaxID=2291674 RepID=A0ABS2QWR8_9BACI|nr:DUF4362 domain-containing protein [Metabacillus iocasae]MBM7703911.1 hypothetical protein [Metabacillus iocasae]